MSALYEIQYQGIAGSGHGALYIGRGVVIGVGIDGGRFSGNYALHNGNLVGQADLTATKSTQLVTGQSLPAGGKVVINFSFPPNFAGGQFHQVTVGGQQVGVAFDKIGDIP